MEKIARIFTVLITVGAAAFVSTELGRQSDVSIAPRQPGYFETIDSASRKANWHPLRSEILSMGTMEIRVWAGFGGTALEGFLIRRIGAKWTALHLRETFSTGKPVIVKKVQPASGWSEFWSKLQTTEILSLPDSSTLPGRLLVKDGMSYVIELKTNGSYRTYSYANPELQVWPEAKKVTEIYDVLRKELVRK